MKHYKSLKVLSALVVAICLPAFAADETAVWLAQNASESGDGILMIPDSKGTYDFMLADAAGVTIGMKPDSPGDAKSIEFSGSQKAAFITVMPIPPVASSISISMQVRAPETSVESGTLIYSSQWEVRHSSKGVVLIIRGEDNVFSNVSLPTKQGVWQTLKATVSADSMTLSVDGEDATGVPKGNFCMSPKPSPLVMGGFLGKEGLIRKFFGSVADIRISVE